MIGYSAHPCLPSVADYRGGRVEGLSFRIHGPIPFSKLLCPPLSVGGYAKASRVTKLTMGMLNGSSRYAGSRNENTDLPIPEELHFMIT